MVATGAPSIDRVRTFTGPERWLLSWCCMRVVVLVVLGVLAFMRHANADAAAHYRQGVAFEKAGAYDEAISEYRKAYTLDKKPSHLFNIARVFDQKGDARSAIDTYERFLQLDPGSPNAKDARAALAIATKKLADEKAARKKAEDEAAARAKQLADEKERVRVAVEAHLKQAAELEKRAAWASAAAEYARAAAVSGDPEHLLAAGEAYRKQPDLAKAKAAFQEYLDKVPAGPRSDEIRGRVADLARQLEEERAAADARAKAKADADARRLQMRSDAPKAMVKRPRGPKERARSRGWAFVAIGGALGATTGLFAFLGTEINADITKGRVAEGADIREKLQRGQIYNYLAIGTAVAAVAAITIGGVTVGLNLGEDRQVTSLAFSVRGSL